MIAIEAIMDKKRKLLIAQTLLSPPLLPYYYGRKKTRYLSLPPLFIL